ncbi:hypothetical protein [Listonella phage phiHSIC]|uniref:hypothetical protein n=1 Tax=Listonella phage phiHSIC TaxID=310539 RepID=UPI00004C7403|nr:hypothetical protein LPPPVgp10 [Listonella phage phiHSIC]AAW67507.1 hypothetical protein [Listonella phage phiHSIC]
MYTHFNGMIVSDKTLPKIAESLGYSYHLKIQRVISVFILTPMSVDRMTYSGDKVILPVYDDDELNHLIETFPGEIKI